MKQSKHTPRWAVLLFTSPWFLLVFLIAPAFTIISHLMHRPYHQNLLLINNGCFLFCVAVRIGWYLIRLPRDIRYGAGLGRPNGVHAMELSAAEVRKRLSGAGFRFDHGGTYGEKHDPGYLGTLLLYAGLLLMLSLGSYDNLRQFSGTVLTGVGDPVPLNHSALYLSAPLTGPMADMDALPQLQVKQIITPNKQWPKGTTRLGLVDDEGKELADGFVTPGKPLRLNGIEYHLAELKYRVAVTIKKNDNQLYGGILNFRSIPARQQGFDYYATVQADHPEQLTVDAWFNPGTRALRLIAVKNGKQIIDSTVQMFVKNKDRQGDYEIALKSMGEGAQIQVLRQRHMAVVFLGAASAVAGLILRLLFRPQRVWLEETATGCRIRTAGRKSRQELGILC